MALANHRVRVFSDVAALSDFIQTDPAILSIVHINNDGGLWILVYTV